MLPSVCGPQHCLPSAGLVVAKISRSLRRKLGATQLWAGLERHTGSRACGRVPNARPGRGWYTHGIDVTISSRALSQKRITRYLRSTYARAAHRSTHKTHLRLRCHLTHISDIHTYAHIPIQTAVLPDPAPAALYLPYHLRYGVVYGHGIGLTFLADVATACAGGGGLAVTGLISALVGGGGGGGGGDRGFAAGGLGGGSFRVGSRYCAQEATMRAAWPNVKPVMHGSTLRAERMDSCQQRLITQTHLPASALTLGKVGGRTGAGCASPVIHEVRDRVIQGLAARMRRRARSLRVGLRVGVANVVARSGAAALHI